MAYGLRGFTAVTCHKKFVLLNVLASQNITLDGKNVTPVYPGFYCFQMGDTLQVSDVANVVVSGYDYPVHFQKVDQVLTTKVSAERTGSAVFLFPVFSTASYVYGAVGMPGFLGTIGAFYGRDDLVPNLSNSATYSAFQSSINDFFKTVKMASHVGFSSTSTTYRTTLAIEGVAWLDSTTDEALDFKGTVGLVFTLLADGTVDTLRVSFAFGGIRNAGQTCFFQLDTLFRASVDNHDVTLAGNVNPPAGLVQVTMYGKLIGAIRS